MLEMQVSKWFKNARYSALKMRKVSFSAMLLLSLFPMYMSNIVSSLLFFILCLIDTFLEILPYPLVLLITRMVGWLRFVITGLANKHYWMIRIR